MLLQAALLLAALADASARGVNVTAARLVNGTDRASGRLEVQVNGTTWGAVCASFLSTQGGELKEYAWHDNSAAVACRQAGFAGHQAWAQPAGRFGSDPALPVVLSGVSCWGNESSLSQCYQAPPGAACPGGSRDVGAVCYDAGLGGGDVRLREGPNATSGRIEVLIAGRWGTVCDDGWDDTAAGVACRRMALGSHGLARPGGAFPQSRDPAVQSIIMENVECTGEELALTDCAYNAANNCQHNEDAGAVCHTPAPAAVLLVNRTNNTSGALQIDANGTWAPVCGDGWRDADAAAVCQFLFGAGYSGRARSPAEAGSGGGGAADPVPARCYVTGCSLEALPASDAQPCNSSAGVACYNPAAPTTPKDSGGAPAAAIAGAAVGGAAALALAALLWLCIRRRRLARQQAQRVAGGGAQQAATFPTRPPCASPASLDSLLTVASGGGSAASGSQQLRSKGSSAGSRTLDTLMVAAGSDPLLSHILQARARSGGSGGGGGAAAHPAGSGSSASRPSGGVHLDPWVVAFEDIQFHSCIGQGSFGRVYLGTWHQIAVAVKVLLRADAGVDSPRALAPSSPGLAKLEAEAGLLASLRHPYIVAFYGICHDPPMILTEYCSRGSLAEVLAGARVDPAAAARLTWPRRLNMALNAALGMLHLHTLPSPIVHRDLKSPNLLVDESYRVQVTDFNLSKLIEDGTQSSSLAAMNPRWLAPEVMRGAPATPASDVFSFGVVLWELLTWVLPWSQAPWAGWNPWQIASHVQRGGRLQVPPAHQLPGPDAPAVAAAGGLDAYCALMRDCWAQEPADRPNFAGVAARLRAQLDEALRAPTAAAPPELAAPGDAPPAGGGGAALG